MINNIEEVEVERILLREEKRHSTTKIDDGGERNSRPKRTMNSYLSRCRTCLENLIAGRAKPSRRKLTVCNGGVREAAEGCGGDGARNENERRGKKWVAAMVVLGVTDLVFALTKFAVCSDAEPSILRLDSGLVDDSSRDGLWLPLCIFTIVGTVLFFPELGNTLSALTRSDGTTYVPLHFELLVTMIFEHVPLATISYFTSKWWSDRVAGRSGSLVEAAVTSSRLMFVSLRIVWYAHMEGVKVRKNDKYELKQVLFMLCCLLFSITLAVPVMTLKLNKDKDSESQQSQKKCSDDEVLWLTSAWEESCLSSTVHGGNIEYGDRQQWKIRSSHKNGTKADVFLQRCLLVSVCDLFNAEGREYLVEYECDHDTVSADASSRLNESSFQKLPQICLAGVERFLFRLYYRTFNQIPDNVKKSESSKGKNHNSYGPASDEVVFTVEWFCADSPHECLTLGIGDAELDRKESAADEKLGEERDGSGFGSRPSVESSLATLRQNLFKFSSNSTEVYVGGLSPKYAHHSEAKVDAGCSLRQLGCL